MYYFFFSRSAKFRIFFFSTVYIIFLPTLVGNYYIIKYEKPIINFNLKEVLKLKKKTLGIFFSTLIQNQAFTLWGVFLIFFSGPLQIAYYSLADQILRAGNGIGNVFQEIFMSIKNKIKINIFFKKISLLFISLFFLSILSIFYAEKIISYIFNEKFLNATLVIRLIIISWFFLTLSKIIGYPLVTKFSEIKLLNKISYVVLIFNISLISINLFFFDANAVNVSIFFLIAVIINLILNIIVVFKKIRVSFL